MTGHPLRRILVARTDKLGDFMLAWPAFRLLKESLPDARIAALVRPYTRIAAEMCPWVDEVLLEPAADEGNGPLIHAMRDGRFDALVTLFSTNRVGYAGWRAGITYRLAPATKFAQFFYNHRLVQRRSRSEKPEWAYNVDLAAQLLRDHDMVPDPVFGPPFLRFTDSADLRRAFCAAHGIDPGALLVFIHPGSGGSAVNLALEQYAALLHALTTARPIRFVVTAGPGEQGRAAQLAALLPAGSAFTLTPADVRQFARHIAFADLWISGSTGPLHVAGALDVPTAAFYPSRRSATALRWQTLNSPDRRAAFSPPPGAGETDMSAIDLAAAAAEISARFLR